ncbi:MAG: DNA methyltransferase [Burkholderiaceae bacterium]
MPLSWNEIKSRAMAFSRRWKDAADEKQQSIPFWIDFFEVFGLTNRRVASFEHAVKKHGGGQGYVDLFWPGQMLVEQKSRGKPLEPAYEQALGYFPGIAERDLPHTLVVCDFARFRVIDLDARRDITFPLKDLHKHVRWFGFIAGYKAQEIKPQDPVNIRAAERMGRLHDALRQSGYAGHPLEVLLVRLLFCLFADDTAIFPAQSFRDFIEERTAPDGSDLGPRLAQLFQVLNTPDEGRGRNLDEQLRGFPYVNGRLFAESLPIADFDAATREALLNACALDWSAISPAIFGSLFQSIMDDKARRNLGAHYTSEENILKLIGPLFLGELRAEFAKVKGHRNRLFDFHKKLRTLTFFDPACGCGNFLVVSYRELRLLELDVLRAAAELQGHAGQRSVDVHQLIGVDVDQFHGIEIEEFPAQIAQVALWLADHQMNLRVSEEFGQYFARIPLKTSPRIVHGNALTLDWNSVLPAARCSYLLGNPPFVGAKYMDDAQRQDTRAVFAGIDNAGLLDLVAAWYVKAARYLRDALAPAPAGGGQGWGPVGPPGPAASPSAAGPHPNLPRQGKG